MTLAYRPWLLDDLIDAPCADISLSSGLDGKVHVLMHFSLIKGGLPNDLEIIFTQVVAVRCMDEAVHSVTVPLGPDVPKLAKPPWRGWTYPLLFVEDSEWFKGFEYLPNFLGRRHLLLVSLNAIVDIMASPVAETRWVSRQDV